MECSILEIVMEEGEEFYYSTPEEIDRLLHKFIKTNTVCVYLKTIDSNNNEVKVGVENGFPLRSWFPHILARLLSNENRVNVTRRFSTSRDFGGN